MSNNNNLSIHYRFSTKLSKTTYYLFYQSFQLNLSFSQINSLNNSVTNSFYSNNLHKNYQNTLFSLKRLNFDERYFAHNRSKTLESLTFRQNSVIHGLTSSTLQKRNLFRSQALRKQFHISNINLFKNRMLGAEKNSFFTQQGLIRSNNKRGLLRTLKQYVPVFNQIRSSNLQRSYNYTQQVRSLNTQNIIFRKLSTRSQDTNYDSLRHFLIISRNRKYTTQNLDLLPLLRKTKPLKFIDSERQFY